MAVEEQDLPVVANASRDALAVWMDAQHARSRGIWLRIAKDASGVATVTYAEALDVALCHGRIDGQKAGLDDAARLQRFTPRTARSRWSRVNRARATELIELGLMRPAGQRPVDAAKADGRWDAAYAGQRTAVVPDYLRAALDADPEASAFLATLDSRNRYAALYRIGDAKRPETRARRVAAFVAMMRDHRREYP